MRSGDTLPEPLQHPSTPRSAHSRKPTLRDLSRAALRHRAVLHEGRRRDEVARRSRKHQPLILTPEQAQQRHRLTAYLAAHGGWPPSVTRSSAARLCELDAMYAVHGALVLLTVNLDHLDSLPLKSEELRDMARELVDSYLDELAQPGAPYTAATQRGAFGGTHSHIALPLACLHPEHAALVLASRPGPGGGVHLLNGDAHAVLMGERSRDRQKVAAYLSRDPDGRLDTPGTAAYLDALEDELERKAGGRRSPRLSWPRGITALRRTLSIK